MSIVGNVLAVILLLAAGAIVGVFVAAFAAVAAMGDRLTEERAAGYRAGWQAARKAWSGRRDQTEHES